jgi:hypothetical protein
MERSKKETERTIGEKRINKKTKDRRDEGLKYHKEEENFFADKLNIKDRRKPTTDSEEG